MYISTTVGKLGNEIGCVNLPAGITCDPDAPCAKCGKCYAKKGRFKFRNVQKSMLNNLDTYKSDLGLYFGSIIHKCQNMEHFRWHSSGDIVDRDYLYGMVYVAQRCPHTKFLAFTKKYKLVDDFLDGGGILPKNLTIVYSAWGNFLPKNPHNLPVSYVRLKSGEGAEHIPDTAKHCSGFCGECVHTNCSCWDLSFGESVAFNEH